MQTDNYQSQLNKDKTTLLRAMMQELPLFCRDFFRSIESTTSILTRINYAYDLRVFFRFLVTDIDIFEGRDVLSLSVNDLELIRPLHLELYLEYLNYYQTEQHEHENHSSGKARKLSTLRSMFKYYFKREAISANVASLIDMPKIHEKPIIRLEPNEVSALIEAVDEGASLSAAQQKYHRFTRERDLALLTLLLGTGMRISELVGIDLGHLDFDINGVQITRKGGNQTIIYFGDEVLHYLRGYIEQRNQLIPLAGHENALFLSLQRRRMSVRAAQELVKKYAKIAAPLKKISPHKLRSTFGTMLYQETGDIYLVADVLGHKDVNTTKKHYAAINDERRRQAAKAVKLTEE